MRVVKTYENFVNEFVNDRSARVKQEIEDRKVTDKEESDEQKYAFQKGELSQYLREHGKVFTFGMLKAIFNEALSAKRKRNAQKSRYKFLHRIVPLVGATINPILWFVSNILGAMRAFNKIVIDALRDPGNKYPDFLKKIIIKTMEVAEGDIKPLLGDDSFYRAFVVSDDITRVLRKDLLHEFAFFLSDKMSKEPDGQEVPHKYIETELKEWLNARYDLSYTFPVKENINGFDTEVEDPGYYLVYDNVRGEEIIDVLEENLGTKDNLLTMFTSDVYPDSRFYGWSQDNLMFEHDISKGSGRWSGWSDAFYVKHNGFWSIFTREFSLQDHDIKQIMSWYIGVTYDLQASNTIKRTIRHKYWGNLQFGPFINK